MPPPATVDVNGHALELREDRRLDVGRHFGSEALLFDTRGRHIPLRDGVTEHFLQRKGRYRALRGTVPEQDAEWPPGVPRRLLVSRLPPSSTAAAVGELFERKGAEVIEAGLFGELAGTAYVTLRRPDHVRRALERPLRLAGVELRLAGDAEGPGGGPPRAARPCGASARREAADKATGGSRSGSRSSSRSSSGSSSGSGSGRSGDGAEDERPGQPASSAMREQLSVLQRVLHAALQQRAAGGQYQGPRPGIPKGRSEAQQAFAAAARFSPYRAAAPMAVGSQLDLLQRQQLAATARLAALERQRAAVLAAVAARREWPGPAAAAQAVAAQQAGGGGQLPCYAAAYFVLVADSRERLLRSVHEGRWPTTLEVAQQLSDAFALCSRVLLFFTEEGGDSFRGYGQMESAPVGESVPMQWLRVRDVPFESTARLVNAWDAGRPVHAGANGQAVPPVVGGELCGLMDEAPEQVCGE